ncbi:MAG: ABC transporter substrate-binding protein [Desulfovibrionaceae bacterium]
MIPAVIVALGLILTLAAPARAWEGFDIAPCTNHGAKWRIGYLEGGPYFNYARNLEALARGLTALGWMEAPNLPGLPADGDTAEIWSALATRTRSDYLQFVPDAWYSAGWSPAARGHVRRALLERLQSGDLDLVLAAGTWAGQDLALPAHHVPVVAFAVSDPVLSGIVPPLGTRGLPNVHVKMDPERYLRMARLFHNVFGFRRLGVTYENSPEGRAHAGVDDMARAAEAMGFSLVLCEAQFSGVSDEAAVDGVVRCQERLAREADAVVIPVHRGVRPSAMSRILAPLLAARIPTFSQQGSLEVRHGVLMGMTLGEAAFTQIGLFHARVVAAILNGAVPAEVPMVFEDPRGIAINRETARRIGWRVPPGLEQCTETFYDAIAPDDEE